MVVGGAVGGGEEQLGDPYVCPPAPNPLQFPQLFPQALLVCSVLASCKPCPLACLIFNVATMYKKLSENERASCILRMFAPEETACLHKILSDSFHLSQEAWSPAGPRKYENWHFVGPLLTVSRCWSPVCHERSEFFR